MWKLTLGIRRGFFAAYSHSLLIFLSLGCSSCKLVSIMYEEILQSISSNTWRAKVDKKRLNQEHVKFLKANCCLLKSRWTTKRTHLLDCNFFFWEELLDCKLFLHIIKYTKVSNGYLLQPSFSLSILDFIVFDSCVSFNTNQDPLCNNYTNRKIQQIFACPNLMKLVFCHARKCYC